MTSGPDGQDYAIPILCCAPRFHQRGREICGGYAPAVTLLLEVSMNSPAVAASGGGGSGHGGSGAKPGNGFGDKNHTHSGPPGQNKKG